MRRDDAGRHRSAEAERVAHGEHPIADPRVVARELDKREGLAVGLDLEQGHVGARIGAHHGGGIFRSVFHRYRDFLCLFDHVIVGHDEAVGRDEEAGALSKARRRLRRRAGHAFAELLEEIVERVVLGQVGKARDLLVVLGDLGIALDVDADHGGAHLLHEIGEGDRRRAKGRLNGLGLGGLGDGERNAVAERQP